MRARVPAFWALLLISIASIFSIGCPWSREYAVVIHNVGEQTIYDAQVSYGSFRSRGGIIGPSGTKGHLGVRHPIPKTAIVEWRSEDGTDHRREVAVESVVPRGCDIYFEIDSDTGQVTVVAKEPPRY